MAVNQGRTLPPVRPQGDLAHAVRPARRSRLAFLVAQRQVLVRDLPILLLRVIGLTVLATFASLTPQPLTLLILLPAIGMTFVRTRLPARERAVRGQSRWWQLEGWADGLAAQLSVFMAAWLLDGLPLNARLAAVGVAVTMVSVASLQACLTPRWYRPDERTGATTEFLRLAAGPLAAAVSAVIALSAAWPSGSHVLVLLLAATPLSVTALTRDQDLTIVHVVRLIQQEAQEGRQMVLDATHGALSTNLRLFEQQARQHRGRAPRLYELAVSANCRLRETLTLADPTRETATGPESLGAVVTTLALAVGARGRFTVSVEQFAEADRDLARLAISDLVGAALAAGAAEVLVDVRLDDGVVVTVRDDAPALATSDQLAALQRRLAEVCGEVRGPVITASGRQTRARWRATSGTR